MAKKKVRQQFTFIVNGGAIEESDVDDSEDDEEKIDHFELFSILVRYLNLGHMNELSSFILEKPEVFAETYIEVLNY